MTVLDAFALIALVNEERAAAEVEDLLRAGDAAIATVNLAEALDRLIRTSGSERDVRAVVDPLVDEAIAVLVLDRALADSAATLRAAHYSARRRAVSIADCICAATARQLGAPLATNDRALLDLCAEEGIAVVELPR